MTTTTKTTAAAFPHYIFGYGSLICPTSRAVTAPTLKHRVATPVKVHHLQRVWSFPVPQCAMTFMGVRRTTGATCVGVLVPVSEEELCQFDVRELGYDRIPLSGDWIEKFPSSKTSSSSCNTTDYNSSTDNSETSLDTGDGSYFDHVLLSSSSGTDKNEPRVWVYLQQDPSPISAQCPLAQTYLDVIMRGCLTISDDFLVEFLRTTRGWSPNDFYDDHNNHHDGQDRDPSKEKNTNNDEEHHYHRATTTTTTTITTYWVNDRHDPLYVRADVEYSLTRGDELDQYLERHRPTEIRHRRPLYGKHHTM